MVYMLKRQAENLIQKAKEEIEGLGDGDEDDETEEERKVRAKECDEMIERISRRVDVKEGVKPETFFEWKVGSKWPDSPNLPSPAQTATMDESGDTEMGGTTGTARGPKQRTKKVIGEELSTALKDLVDMGCLQLRAYDNHAAETTKHYQCALDRRVGKMGSGGNPRNLHRENTMPTPVSAGSRPTPARFASSESARKVTVDTDVPSVSGRPSAVKSGGMGSASTPVSAGMKKPVGILRNKNVESPVDVAALRRMSDDKGRAAP